MVLEHPEWLALLPLLALAGWIWRGLALQRPLRAALLIALVLILCGPRLRRLEGGMDLWVLRDRSASTGARVDQGWAEWRQLLEKGKRGRADRMRVIDYAADAVPLDLNAGGPFTGRTNETRTGEAVRGALALRDPDKTARVLVFTDGHSTEPLGELADKLAADGVPLDIRILPEPPGRDARIRSLKMPDRAQAGEPFLVEVEISGEDNETVPLTISRNGRKLVDSDVKLDRGRGVARFTDRAEAGSFLYEAIIAPVEDTHSGNNRYESWIEVNGGPRLLLITGYKDDPAEAVLRGQGFAVETVTDAKSLHPGRLSGARAVVINNVPAWEMQGDFLAALPFYVTGQGGGLLMAGGDRSFGAGGYFKSALDELLPVSMELKKDQRKLRAAMAIIMDRSGSMAAPAGGGTKMDLADEGAAQAIELLGYQDEVAVYAVDSEAHEIQAMGMIGDDDTRVKMQDRVRRVQSQGGGIFVYNGLKAGWRALQQASAGTRHLILFSDAADSEQPEDYVRLLKEMTDAGATVSVIALGTEADSDAGFLKDIAKRGNGRIFFTERAEEVPNIFTAETVAVTRNSFIKDPVAASATGQWFEISAKPMEWLPTVDAYNLSYTREWASQALVSGDEYVAPLVAWGRRGSGRSMAVSFPLGGEHSAGIRAWPKYGDFLQTSARWLMGEDLPPGLGLRTEVTGTQLGLDLFYTEDWEEKFQNEAPRALVAEGARAGEGRELTWERVAPGHYRATLDLSEGLIVRGAVSAGGHALPFGPLASGTQAEWAFDPARVEELRQTSARSGGRELLDLTQAWLSPPVPRFTDIRPWLLPLALLLMLADALVTRTGWKLPDFAGRLKVKLPKRRPAAVPVAVAPAIVAPVVEVPAPTPEAAPEPRAEDAAAARRERFARAKRNG